MATGGETSRRASVFEVIGAWLHVWTAPRDVDIPPVPWRKLAIGAGVGAVVIAGALAVMIPHINSGKDQRAADYRAFQDHAVAVNRARIVHEQRPRHGADAALKPAAGAPAAELQAARATLVTRVEAAILADSQARSRAGEMRKIEGPTTCAVTPGTRTGGPVGVFDCFTVSRTITSTSRTAGGSIGYPFRAVVDFKDFSYTWCKTEQFPGEKLIPDPRLVVALPTACQAPKDALKKDT